MKKYPLGIQTFSEIVAGNYIYADKTEFVYKLAHYAKFHFLSRPRGSVNLFLSLHFKLTLRVKENYLRDLPLSRWSKSGLHTLLFIST